MSKNTTNQTNYQIVQTGGKLEMNTEGTASVQDALGYPEASTKLEASFIRRFGREKLARLRAKHAINIR